MGQQDRLTDASGAGQGGRSSEEVLQSFTQDLRQLQHELLVQLTRDVERLGTEKARLAIDVDRLRVHRQRLQATQQGQLAPRAIDPSVQQWAQQWAKQLARHMGTYLQGTLDRRFDDLEERLFDASQTPSAPPLPASQALALSENTDRLVASLDGTLQRLFGGLQRDLASYETDLGRRVRRMRTLQQQGDAVLDAIVERFDHQLTGDRAATAQLTGTPSPVTTPVTTPEDRARPLPAAAPLSPQDVPTPDGTAGVEAEEERAAPATAAPGTTTGGATGGGMVPVDRYDEEPAWFAAGLLAVFAAIVTGAINVGLKLLFGGSATDVLFGAVSVPGALAPSLGNVLLVLTLRMAVVTALFPVVMTWLQPTFWQEFRDLWGQGSRDRWLLPVVAGFCLFLSQTALYMAIGWLPTGIAIALFFVYPAVTLAASGPLFGDRLSPLKLLAMAAIAAGLACVAPISTLTGSSTTFAGTVWAVVAGITFAGFALLSRMSRDRGAPAVGTLISFAAAFVFASLSLIMRPVDLAAIEVNPGGWNWLAIGCVALSLAALVNLALSDLAIRFGSAALASLASAAAPVVTAAVGTIAIAEDYSFLQLAGIAFVSLGSIFLSIERSFDSDDDEDDSPVAL